MEKFDPRLTPLPDGYLGILSAAVKIWEKGGIKFGHWIVLNHTNFNVVIANMPKHLDVLLVIFVSICLVLSILMNEFDPSLTNFIHK